MAVLRGRSEARRTPLVRNACAPFNAAIVASRADATRLQDSDASRLKPHNRVAMRRAGLPAHILLSIAMRMLI